MKQFIKLTQRWLPLLMVSISFAAFAQDEKPTLLMELGYHLSNNSISYVSVFTKSKIEKKFIPVAGINVKIYMGQEADANLIGTIKTNKDGKAVAFFPPTMKAKWDSADKIALVAASVEDKKFSTATSEASFTKAKITIDTSFTDGARYIVATVVAKNGAAWTPVKDVETKIIIKRSLGALNVGDAENYTTDSSGQASAEFKKIGIPGDLEGNITVIAKTEDNETYGSISIERKLKWGSNYKDNSNDFNRRTLFATRDKSPLWLLLLAGSIFIGVWSVIIYLITQIIKIRKLGLD